MTKSLLEVYRADFNGFEDSFYSDSTGDKWSAKYLYEKANECKLKPEKVKLRHLDLSHLPWQDGSIQNMDCFIYHAVRVQDCDTSIPIIMRQDGQIIDGWHRVAKAVLEGKREILAYRFEGYIEPEKRNGENNCNN
jgi:hypothetical protein